MKFYSTAYFDFLRRRSRMTTSLLIKEILHKTLLRLYDHKGLKRHKLFVFSCFNNHECFNYVDKCDENINYR